MFYSAQVIYFNNERVELEARHDYECLLRACNLAQIGHLEDLVKVDPDMLAKKNGSVFLHHLIKVLDEQFDLAFPVVRRKHKWYRPAALADAPEYLNTVIDESRERISITSEDHRSTSSIWCEVGAYDLHHALDAYAEHRVSEEMVDRYSVDHVAMNQCVEAGFDSCSEQLVEHDFMHWSAWRFENAKKSRSL